jgi:hypothetical protein
MEDKVRENRLRRVAQRQGYTLQKSKRRDPRAIDYGLFLIVDQNNRIVAKGRHGEWLEIDEVEEWLNEP